MGAPCWAHVATTDQQSTQEFYGRLFGWRPEVDAAGYVRMYLGEEPVAGISPLILDNQPDVWRMRVLVADVDLSVQTARRLGATVLVKPADLADTGRGAVLLDPTDAVFEVWQAGTFHGATVFSEPGAPSWFELATRDTAAAKDFYTRLFGWIVSESDWGGATYSRCGLDGRSFASIVAMSRDHPADVPPRWLVYFGASDIRATVARAGELGGLVGAAPVELPGGGGFAGLHDPQDAAFALFRVPAPGQPAARQQPDEPTLLGLLFDHDKYGELVADRPVTRVRYFDGSPVWLVTRHEYVERLLQDPTVSIDPRRQRRLDAASAPGLPADFVRYMRSAVGSVDPPVHTRLRRLVGGAFTLTRVGRMRGHVGRITDNLLDDLATRDEVDLIEEFAYPLAIQVICDLIGVPDGARDGWREAASQLLWSPPEEISVGAQRILDYTKELIALRRATPADDLLSELVRTHDEDGDRLSDDELVAMVITFLNAGHETTAHLVGNGVFALLTHPDQLAVLRADPALLPRAVDELLRFAGPADLGIPRYTTAPVEIGGVRIPAGETVQVVYAAANRDPRRFADPHHLDITRSDNPHLGFGWGIHYCLGSHLGKAQGETALGSLLGRFPDIGLAVPAERVVLRRGFARGLQRLPVRLGADRGRDERKEQES